MRESRLVLSFAAIQALGSAVSISGFFVLPAASLVTRLAWLALTMTPIFAGIVWFVRRPSPSHGGDVLPADDTPARAGRPPAGSRVHRLIPLTIWSAVASTVVVYMSDPLTAIVLVGLAPVWVCSLSAAAFRVSPHRPTVVMLSSLLCGIFGAWLGSAGNASTLLGLGWYLLAGYVVGEALAEGDAFMSAIGAVASTAVFLGVTWFLVSPVPAFLEPSSFVREGAIFFGFEAYQVILGGWLWRVLPTCWRRRLTGGGSRASRLPG
ncbi:MAG: hypothetical protein JWM95_2343 [Gemmatimonadetes bacterium]|nr:hypothetical protein [Gemmatimonadota bacterium]